MGDAGIKKEKDILERYNISIIAIPPPISLLQDNFKGYERERNAL